MSFWAPGLFEKKSVKLGGDESVFFFSGNLESQGLILRHYGRWHDVEAPADVSVALGENYGVLVFF